MAIAGRSDPAKAYKILHKFLVFVIFLQFTFFFFLSFPLRVRPTCSPGIKAERLSTLGFTDAAEFMLTFMKK